MTVILMLVRRWYRCESKKRATTITTSHKEPKETLHIMIQLMWNKISGQEYRKSSSTSLDRRLQRRRRRFFSPKSASQSFIVWRNGQGEESLSQGHFSRKSFRKSQCHRPSFRTDAMHEKGAKFVHIDYQSSMPWRFVTKFGLATFESLFYLKANLGH